MLTKYTETPVDIALRETEGTDGLDRMDVCDLYDLIAAPVIPIEIEAKEHECQALGFISTWAAEKLSWDYAELKEYIQNILDDMGNESEDGLYTFEGIRIWMSR